MVVPGRGLARTRLGTHRVFILGPSLRMGEQIHGGGKEHGSTRPSHPAHPHVHRNKPTRRLFMCWSALCLASGLASPTPTVFLNLISEKATPNVYTSRDFLLHRTPSRPLAQRSSTLSSMTFSYLHGLVPPHLPPPSGLSELGLVAFF